MPSFWCYVRVGPCTGCDDDWVRLWVPRMEARWMVIAPKLCASCWERETGKRPSLEREAAN